MLQIFSPSRATVRKLWLLISFWGVLGLAHVQAQYAEYQIKAGWLCSFARYVTWPEGAFGKNNVVVIGILGDNPFGDDLKHIAANRKVNGRTIEIKVGREISQLQGAHIIFISNSNQHNIEKIFENYKSRRGILTIGDGIDNFTALGGIINFSKNRPTTFTINLTAALESRLIIHSRLLELASKLVQDDK